MEQEVLDFAESVEGQNIILLHDAGYKLGEFQRDLTPLQTLFLIAGLNHKAKVQSEAFNQQSSNNNNGSLSSRNSSVRSDLKSKTKQRWKERGES